MFKHTDDTEFARRPGKPNNYVCYRTVICHALFEYNKQHYNDIKNIFEQLYDAYKNQHIIKNDSFLEFYPIPMNKKKWLFTCR